MVNKILLRIILAVVLHPCLLNLDENFISEHSNTKIPPPSGRLRPKPAVSGFAGFAPEQ
jgi:hypothetical protein